VKRALLAVVLVVAAYFLIYFSVAFAAGAKAGAANPTNASQAGAQAGARAVEENRPYIIGGALTIGILLAGFIPLGRKSSDGASDLPPDYQSEVDATRAAMAEIKAPNPLWHLIKPAAGLCAIGLSVFFWWQIYKFYKGAQGAAISPGGYHPAVMIQSPQFPTNELARPPVIVPPPKNPMYHTPPPVRFR
jgi:hypothetical protein